MFFIPSNKPHADKVACEARMLLAEFIMTLCTVREAAMSSAIKVVEIIDKCFDIPEQNTFLCMAVTTDIKNKYLEAASFLCNVSCFAELQNKISDVSNGDPISFCALSLMQYSQFQGHNCAGARLDKYRD
jgi:hypothetical protein